MKINEFKCGRHLWDKPIPNFRQMRIEDPFNEEDFIPLCGKSASLAYLINVERKILYRCKEHKVAWNFRMEIEEISFEDAVVYEIMNS